MENKNKGNVEFSIEIQWKEYVAKKREKWIGANTNDNLCVLSRELKCIKQWMVENEKPETLSEPCYEKWTHVRYVPFVYWNTSWFCVYVCAFFLNTWMTAFFDVYHFIFPHKIGWSILNGCCIFTASMKKKIKQPRIWENKKNGKQDCGICHIWCEIIKVEKEWKKWILE